MGMLIIILLIALTSAYVTSIPCRVLFARRRRPGWFLGFLGAAIVGLLTVLCIYQGDVFHPERWDRGKVSLILLMPMAFGFSTVIGLIPALLVVTHYRWKFREQYEWQKNSCVAGFAPKEDSENSPQ